MVLIFPLAAAALPGVICHHFLEIAASRISQTTLARGYNHRSTQLKDSFVQHAASSPSMHARDAVSAIAL
jgi:hypothetical protein